LKDKEGASKNSGSIPLTRELKNAWLERKGSMPYVDFIDQSTFLKSLKAKP